MRNFLRNIGLILCVTMMIFTMVGCSSSNSSNSSDENKTESFSIEEINAVDIKTEAHNIKIRSTDKDKLIVSLNKYNEQLASLENGTLKINVHESSNKVSFEGAETLYIDIPNDGCNAINIVSNLGNITIDGISVITLQAESSYGDISITGLEGMVEANTNMGEIKTSLPISSNIAGAGQRVSGKIGNFADDTHTITLYTNAGNIILE